MNVLTKRKIWGYFLQFLATLRGLFCWFFHHFPFPGEPEISKKWLSRCVNRGVSEISISGLKNNRGLVGITKEVKVRFKSGDSEVFVLKSSRNGVSGRMRVLGGGDYREPFFYSDPKFSHQFKSILPEIVYALGSSFLGEYVILSKKIEGISLAYFFGNQVWGVPEHVELPEGDRFKPLYLLEKMLLCAAEMHALYWNDKNLLKKNWLKGVNWKFGKDRVSWELAIERGRRSWQGVLANEKKKALLDEKLVRLITKSFEMANWNSLRKHLDASDFTLCHGDFHAHNMILQEDGVIKMCDFSEIGVWEPAADLAQTVISDVRATIWGENGRNIKSVLKTYHGKLRELNPSIEYSFEKCLHDFGRCGMERWIWVFAVLANYPMEARVIQYFHDQILNFWNTFSTNLDKNEIEYFELKPVVMLT